MKDVQTIKERLSAIQSNFNPQKNTYKVIEYVVNNKLTYKQMLMELSKIKGFDKYPDELKKEYVSIIKEIKRNIVKQMKDEERERQEANTQELKDIISSLEKRKEEYTKKLDEVVNKDKSEEVSSPKVPLKEERENAKEENVSPVNDKKPVLTTNSSDNEEEKIEKIKKVLLIGIVIVIFLTVLVVLFY